MTPGGVAGLGDALHQGLQGRRIAFGAGLDVEGRNRPGVGGVLVLVDRRAHLAQIAAQLRLALALDAHPRQRHHRRGEDQQDRRDDEQLDEGEAALRTNARMAFGIRIALTSP